MSRFLPPTTDEDHQPVTWFRGHPVYAAHLIVAALSVSMVVTTLMLAFEGRALLAMLEFTSPEVLAGQLWRPFTYGLVNPPGLGFVIDMVMLVFFGREVEKYLGRRAFVRLYVALYLLTPVLLTILGLFGPRFLSGQTGSFAIFIAFAVLYPNVPMFFNVLAKWVAGILVAVYTLVALSGRDWSGLLALWATTGFAFAYIRHAQGHFNLPAPRLPARPPARPAAPATRFAPAPPAAPRPTARGVPPPGPADIDALLDKISRDGIHSLTPAERAKLDEAQARLAKRGGRS
jgi:membrane associated rhomboid family serine protease